MSMAAVDATPGIAGSELIASVQRAKEQQRAQKRENSRSRQIARRLVILLALAFAAVGLGSGSAAAAPWDIKEDLESSIMYMCSPMDVPTPSGHEGVDTIFGMDNPSVNDVRATVIPDAEAAATGPVGATSRLEQAYEGQAGTIAPTYERYGFNGLRWDNYGGSCYSPSYWFNLFSNGILSTLVHLPTMLAMTLMNAAMGHILYDVFAMIMQFPISVITAIFVPWIYIVAPIGVMVVWVTSRSSKNTMKAAVWAVLMLGTVTWLGNNTTPVVRAANNIVTEIANFGAARFNDPTGAQEQSDELAPGISGLSSGTDSTLESADALTEVNQALWYGVPYQAWLEGSVGTAEAATARQQDSTGAVSWGAALLNGNYVGDDDDGQRVLRATEDWNSRSYMHDGNDTKTDGWTDEALWKDSPYLFNIKTMCADTYPGGNGSNSDDDNLWMYNGNCNASEAGATQVVDNYQGNDFNRRLITSMAGCVAALAVLLAVGGVSIYLAVQKMLFFFMLLLAPVFLTIASFSDNKRVGIGKRYFELMLANIIKQIVAVLMVLFIANAMSMLLYPPSGQEWAAIREVPWMLKPLIAILFFIAMVIFARPLMKTFQGAAKGDTSVVDKAANAPIDTAKTATKIGAGAALLVGGVALTAATGGAAAPVLAKSAMGLKAAGHMAGRGATGRSLRRVGSAVGMAAAGNAAYAQRTGRSEALDAGVKTMLSGPEGESMKAELAAAGGVNKDGSLTPVGHKMARDKFKTTAKAGLESSEATARQDQFMAQFYEGYRKQNNGQHHVMDPSSPENKREAAVLAAQERDEINKAAQHSSKKGKNTGTPGTGAPNAPAAVGVPVSGGSNPETTGAEHTGDTGTDPSAAAASAGAAVAPEVIDGKARETAQQAYATQARDNVTGPSFARDANIKTTVATPGAEVLSEMGINQEQAAADPTQLVTSNAYNGGHTTTMDPMHPATQHLNGLRFAMINGTDEEIDDASAKASSAIMEHGVPDHIKAVGSTGETAKNFQGAQIVGAMPSISENTPWQERAEAANTMQAAAMTLPQGDSAAEPVDAYVRALSNPAVEAPEVEALKAQAIDALAVSDQARSEAPEGAGFLNTAAATAPQQATAAQVPAAVAAPAAAAAAGAAAVGHEAPQVVTAASSYTTDSAAEATTQPSSTDASVSGPSVDAGAPAQASPAAQAGPAVQSPAVMQPGTVGQSTAAPQAAEPVAYQEAPQSGSPSGGSTVSAPADAPTPQASAPQDFEQPAEQPAAGVPVRPEAPASFADAPSVAAQEPSAPVQPVVHSGQPGQAPSVAAASAQPETASLADAAPQAAGYGDGGTQVAAEQGGPGFLADSEQPPAAPQAPSQPAPGVAAAPFTPANDAPTPANDVSPAAYDVPAAAPGYEAPAAAVVNAPYSAPHEEPRPSMYSPADSGANQAPAQPGPAPRDDSPRDDSPARGADRVEGPSFAESAARPAYTDDAVRPSWDQAPPAYADRPSYDGDIAPADYRSVPGYSDSDYAERVRYEDSVGPAAYFNADYAGFQGHPDEATGWEPTAHASGAPLIAPVPASAEPSARNGQQNLRQDIREGIREANRDERNQRADAPAAEQRSEGRIGPDPREQDRSRYVASSAHIPTQPHRSEDAPAASGDDGGRPRAQGLPDERRGDERPTPFRRSKRRRVSGLFGGEEANEAQDRDANDEDGEN